MRLSLNLEDLHVQTTVVQPEETDLEGPEGVNGGFLASVVYNTLTIPIQRPNTRSSPCVA